MVDKCFVETTVSVIFVISLRLVLVWSLCRTLCKKPHVACCARKLMSLFVQEVGRRIMCKKSYGGLCAGKRPSPRESA